MKNNNIVNVTRRPSNMWQTQVTRNNVSRSKASCTGTSGSQ